MEKQKGKVVPKEVPEQRPDLYFVETVGKVTGINFGAIDAVWLWNGREKVIIKSPSVIPSNSTPEQFMVGHRKLGAPTGPKYTGPIDDEMMANILIYG